MAEKKTEEKVETPKADIIRGRMPLPIVHMIKFAPEGEPLASAVGRRGGQFVELPIGDLPAGSARAASAQRADMSAAAGDPRSVLLHHPSFTGGPSALATLHRDLAERYVVDRVKTEEPESDWLAGDEGRIDSDMFTPDSLRRMGRR